jgi:hypothetical protein
MWNLGRILTRLRKGEPLSPFVRRGNRRPVNGGGSWEKINLWCYFCYFCYFRSFELERYKILQPFRLPLSWRFASVLFPQRWERIEFRGTVALSRCALELVRGLTDLISVKETDRKKKA